MAIVSMGLTEAGLKSEFFQRLSATPTYYGDLATRIQSNKDKETYRFLGSIPRVREWGTGRLAKGVNVESYDVENLKYEATLEVDRDEIDDDQTGQIRLRVNELAVNAATHPDWLIAQLLINGATAGYLSFDGLTFFNDAHVSGDSGNQDNDLTYDATDHTAVTVAEFKLALAQAMTTMLGFKDDQGQSLRLAPSGLVIIVPPALYVTALEAVGATVIASTTNILQGAARVIPLPEISTATTWYLLKTDGHIRPFIFQDRMPIEFGALEQNSETGFIREVYLYGVRARYRVTYGHWAYAVRTLFN